MGSPAMAEGQLMLADIEINIYWLFNDWLLWEHNVLKRVYRSRREFAQRRAAITGAEGSTSTIVFSVMTWSKTATELSPALKSASFRIFTTSCLMGSSSSSSLFMLLLRSCNLWNRASSMDPRVRVSSRAARRRLSYASTTLATY